ncbi:glycerol dehydrogenase (plasmid) [Enterobacter bugandensis]|uniref:glycerol dehydrogenase n=1 Tax=Enterobacter bugandensis TaxID=881260 RepID=UPI00283A96F5|nr:glycerol dehydrogenase [Enterobacter bugandensis]WMU75424.1 glycerol dehydrogenase [Enterobacter bugandensis]
MRVIQSPGKYIQGPDALCSLNEYIQPLGSRWLILVDPAMKHHLPRFSTKSADNLHFHPELFRGQCSRQEIQRIAEHAESHRCDGIIGFGGGKVLDTAKAVAFHQRLRSVMLPTVASTDAPTSALSVIYTEEGEFEQYLFFPANPDMVIVDSTIIASAPVRLLVSGMGDALSTWFEAQACYESRSANMSGGQTTRAALTLARLCYDTLLQEGKKAKIAAEQKVTCRALERIIEANTYLSGIGFESSGLAAAHAIHNGLTQLADCHHFYHGEKVAFGTLTQLVLQNSSDAQINEVLDFCISVGLPVCLEQLGVTENVREKMRCVADKSCSEGETIFNMPFCITSENVYSALLIADQLGRQKLGLNCQKLDLAA